MVVQEVAPGVFTGMDGIGANVGLINTDGGAVLVDAPLIPAQARAWRAEIERLSPRGVAYIVNTDYHLGHMLGTGYLPHALTIAHETAWRQLRSLDRQAVIDRAVEQYQDRVPDLIDQLADLQLPGVQMAVGRALTLHLPGRQIDIVHLGGHSSASLVVYVPDAHVLFAGDVVVNGQHPYAGDAHTRRWLEALDWIRGLDAEIIVPGHGAPGGRELAEPVYAYVHELHTRVEACFLTGHTRRETVERVKLVDAFPVAPGCEERLRRVLRTSVERVYDEIKKEALRARQCIQ